MKLLMVLTAFFPVLVFADMIGINAAPVVRQAKESALFSRPKTAANMLEPWHENRPVREPDWEDRLTFSEGTLQSVDDLMKLLKKNSWRTIYHCDGYPADGAWGIYNGITLPFTYAEYGDQTVERRYAYDPKSPQASTFQELNKSYRYEIKQLGSNKFQISYQKKDPEKREIKLLKVDQTNEWVLQAGSHPGKCEDGTTLTVLWAPYQTMN